MPHIAGRFVQRLRLSTDGVRPPEGRAVNPEQVRDLLVAFVGGMSELNLLGFWRPNVSWQAPSARLCRVLALLLKCG